MLTIQSSKSDSKAMQERCNLVLFRINTAEEIHVPQTPHGMGQRTCSNIAEGLFFA